MHNSQRSEWTDCCQHEQEISILQQKLIEVHNKLIDQLDICKEQQLTIIELNKQLQNQQKVSTHSFETFNYQSFGQQSDHQENRQPNYYHSSTHDSRQSQQAKAELLQADLQAMRNKVLAEITQKNKLKQETKEMKSKYKRELGTQVKKNQQLENQYQKLKEDYELLKIKYEKSKKSTKVEADVDKLAQLLVDAEAKYLKEKDLNKQLNTKLKAFENTYHPSETKSYVPQQASQEKKHSLKPELHPSFEKKYRLQKEPQKQCGSGGRDEDQFKRKSFEETRDLIKKLEETESYMRRNRRPVT